MALPCSTPGRSLPQSGGILTPHVWLKAGSRRAVFQASVEVSGSSSMDGTLVLVVRTEIHPTVGLEPPTSLRANLQSELTCSQRLSAQSFLFFPGPSPQSQIVHRLLREARGPLLATGCEGVLEAQLGASQALGTFPTPCLLPCAASGTRTEQATRVGGALVVS